MDCSNEASKAVVFPVIEPMNGTQINPEFWQLQVWYFTVIQS